MDMHNILSLFTYGIPQYIIPAVPYHAVTYMLTDFLKFHNQELSTDKVKKERSPIKELSSRPENFQPYIFFVDVVSAFPKDIIAGHYPDQDMLFFSYAKEGEICPDSCQGSRDRCPTFGRKKPETITEYTRKLIDKFPG